MTTKGFISAPTLDQLQPTPEEQQLLRELLEWQEQSAKSHYILGGSVECQSCHASNNPNNITCWQCGRAMLAEREKKR